MKNQFFVWPFKAPLRVEVREPQQIVAAGAPVPDSASIVGANWRQAAVAARGHLFHFFVFTDVWREVT